MIKSGLAIPPNIQKSTFGETNGAIPLPDYDWENNGILFKIEHKALDLLIIFWAVLMKTYGPVFVVVELPLVELVPLLLIRFVSERYRSMRP